MTKYAKTIWAIGGAMLAIGATVSAFNSEQNDSVSEGFRDLPESARALATLAIGIVCGHWLWPMPVREINANTEEN